MKAQMPPPVPPPGAGQDLADPGESLRLLASPGNILCRAPFCCHPGLSPAVCQERAWVGGRSLEPVCSPCWSSWAHFLNSQGLCLLLLLLSEAPGAPGSGADSWEGESKGPGSTSSCPSDVWVQSRVATCWPCAVGKCKNLFVPLLS